MRLIRFILLMAVGLLPVLPLVAGVPVSAAEIPGGCCVEQCSCSVEAACPCAASPGEDAPAWPVMPSPDRVVIQHLFDRYPRPLFEQVYADESTIPAVAEQRTVLPTQVGQRLSFLCLRVV